MFFHLRGDHLLTLHNFLKSYASSRSLHAGMYYFAEFLWEHGLLDPQITLRIIAVIAENSYETEESRRSDGGEKLIRMVLRIYADPSTRDATRRDAMDVFDRLMERYSTQGNQILEEWDRT